MVGRKCSLEINYERSPIEVWGCIKNESRWEQYVGVEESEPKHVIVRLSREKHKSDRTL